jgi:hypothetical protein
MDVPCASYVSWPVLFAAQTAQSALYHRTLRSRPKEHYPCSGCSIR